MSAVQCIERDSGIVRSKEGGVVVQDGNKPHIATDSIELWQQWNETTSKMWLQAMENSKEAVKGATVDPYSFYRSWMKNVNVVQEQVKGIPLVMNPRDMWNAWFSATMETWKKAAEIGGDPLGLTRQWLNLMENAQAQMLAGETLPTDPFTFFREWYNATSEQWSKTVEEAIGSEKFLAYSAPYLESYTSLTKTFRKASEEYFKKLQLPTVSDIARVAELIINLEEKIDKMEDALDTLEANSSNVARVDTVKEIERRLDTLATEATVANVEKRLDTLATSTKVEDIEKQLDTLATTATVVDLEKRFDCLATVTTVASLEKQLDNLATVTKVEDIEKQLDTLATSTKVEGLEKRLDQVESKLDQVLTLLEKIQVTETTQRKTQKKIVAHRAAHEVSLEG